MREVRIRRESLRCSSVLAMAMAVAERSPVFWPGLGEDDFAEGGAGVGGAGPFFGEVSVEDVGAGVGGFGRWRGRISAGRAWLRGRR